jgi:hypothetical protein
MTLHVRKHTTTSYWLFIFSNNEHYRQEQYFVSLYSQNTCNTHWPIQGYFISFNRPRERFVSFRQSTRFVYGAISKLTSLLVEFTDGRTV